MTPMVCQCLALRLDERRGSTALVASFISSLHSSVMTVLNLSLTWSEARDLRILSVTRGLFHRSEKVPLHRMIRAIPQAVRGGVKAVMPRCVGCVAQPIISMTRGVGCVRVTRSIMSRHVRQNITSVAMVVPRATAAISIAAAPAAPTNGSVTAAAAIAAVAGPVKSAITVAATAAVTGETVTAAATVATVATVASTVKPAIAAAATVTGETVTAAATVTTVATVAGTVKPAIAAATLSRSRSGSSRACDTHTEDRQRCIPFNVPHAFISCGNHPLLC